MSGRTVHRYRVNAEQCLILAERATTRAVREEYKRLAAQWLKMAANADHLEQLGDRLKSDYLSTCRPW